MKKLINFATNAALVIVSILAVTVFIEFIIFPHIFPHLPEKYYHYGTRKTRRLLQPSVEGVMPKNGYIALLGDSYAAGAGDWFNSNGWDLMSEYHSANIIHHRLNKDVFVFATPGANSVHGACVHPIDTYRYIRSLGFELPEPETVILYFFEGNDLYDNRIFLEKYRGKADGSACSEEEFDAYLDSFVTEHATGIPEKWNDRLLFTNMLYRMAYYKPWLKIPDFKPEPPGDNMLKINGEKVQAPSHLLSFYVKPDSKQKRLGLCVLRASLKISREYFKNSRYILVYLPAPATTYHAYTGSFRVNHYFPEANLVVAEEDIQKMSDAIADEVKAITARYGIEFLDARPAIRKAATKVLLHGPTDWTHFNRVGYTVLGNLVSGYLEKTASMK